MLPCHSSLWKNELTGNFLVPTFLFMLFLSRILIHFLGKEMWNDVHWYREYDSWILLRWYRIQSLKITQLEKELIWWLMVILFFILYLISLTRWTTYRSLVCYLKCWRAFRNNIWRFSEGFGCFLFTFSRYHLWNKNLRNFSILSSITVYYISPKILWSLEYYLCSSFSCCFSFSCHSSL